MAELIKLRRQIKSINTNRKITNAMRLISMSLYAKLEKKNLATIQYKNRIETIFVNAIKANPSWKNPIIMQNDLLDSNPLYIFIASTKGFCGSFNNNLIQHFKINFFKEEHQSIHFVTVGKKATTYIKDKPFGKMILSFDNLNLKNYVSICDEILQIITSAQAPYSSINVYSNSFVNFFIQKPQKISLTPINLKNLISQKEDKSKENQIDEIIWEGDQNKILDHLAIKYLRTQILHFLFQSLLAEQASRFVAMDAATTNADKILEKLTRNYNKSRQATITKELLELSSSFSGY